MSTIPNWVSNSLEIADGKEFLADLATHMDEDYKVENFFDKFYKMPSELKLVVLGSREIDGKRVTKWYETEDGESVAITPEKLAELQRTHGATDWYDWAVKFYGTKWDTDATVSGDFLYFDTAWSPPEKFMLTLSQAYSQVKFRLAFSEGGAGYYGWTDFRDGKVVGEFYSEDFWADNVDFDELGEVEEGLTDECRKHIEDYGLHVGG